MQIEIENVNSLERKVTIGVKQEQVNSKVDAKIKELSKKVSIKGFRSGKVPASVIKSKYGPSIRNEVLDDIINDSVKDIVEKQDLKLARMPTLEKMVADEGKDVECVLSLEIIPNVELKPFSELNIEKYKVNPSDSEIEEYIKNIREAKPMRETVQREAKEGDVVVVNLEVNFADKAINDEVKDRTAKDFQIKLNGTYEFPELEKALIGMKHEDKKEVKLKYPEDYAASRLAGQEANFAVEVISVKKETLPEIDYKFLKEIFKIKEKEDKVDNVLERFKAEAKAKLSEEIEKECYYYVSEKVLEKLNEVYNIEIPKSMLEQETKQIKYEQNFDKSRNPDMLLLEDSEIEQEAVKRARLGIILNAIVEKENIKLDGQTMNSKLQEAISVIMKSNPMAFSALNSKDERVKKAAEEMVRKQILVMKVIEHVLSSSNITEKVMTVAEVEKLLEDAS